MRQDEEQISKLLRLKRYEQPPAEYFEDFLGEFHKRQRAQLLKRSAWRIAIEQTQSRLQGVFSQFSFSQYSYAGASLTVLLVAGIYTANILKTPGGGSFAGSPVAVVPTEAASTFQTASKRSPIQTEFGGQELTLNPTPRFTQSIPFPQRSTTQNLNNPRPRYVLDARPVSYEPPSNF
jgi:hypothetical protein